jgi:hypothetical protein
MITQELNRRALRNPRPPGLPQWHLEHRRAGVAVRDAPIGLTLRRDDKPLDQIAPNIDQPIKQEGEGIAAQGLNLAPELRRSRMSARSEA